ncbi:MAG: hydantoinase B/oxoprolinase family protein [Gammaproteobacteria bacterium]|nr:hydantoinase B/oxoprolinase family protein [Gammaproteobacteria bacterium]
MGHPDHANAAAVAAQSLKEMMGRHEALFAETGRYCGIAELALKNGDPLRYESFNTRLRSLVVGARETSKKISASPGVREVGESVVALFTPEGDSIALSTGIVIHVHTLSRFIKWMLAHDYELDPGIAPGDVFANNDPFVSDVHQADLMTVTPLFWEGELVGWAGAVCHEIEIGGIVGGANMGTTAERFGNGLTVTAEKIGQNDTVRKDYYLRAEYNLRTPIFWILDQKAMVSACLDVREKVWELIRDNGIEYYRQATRELIEEGRRGHLERVKAMTVPGRYRVPAFNAHMLKGRAGVPPFCEDLMGVIPLEITISPDGMMKVSLDGIGPQTMTPYNATVAALEGVLFVALTQFMDYDGKVNDGAYYGLDIDVPSGTWGNPDSPLVSIGGVWSLIMPTAGAWMRAMSRAFLARGYKEEVFVGAVTTPLIEGGGLNAHGQRFGGQMLDGAAQGSGARGIMDGIDCGYVGWNPESDSGNLETWEQYLPILYLGSRMVRDQFGYGKFRGGVTHSPLFKVHRTPVFSFITSVHSDRVFDNAGLCGGYPAPTAKYTHTVLDSDVVAKAQARQPLPHVEGDPNAPEVARLLEGEYRLDKGFGYHSLKDGDVFQFFYNSGGGYGDVIERDPALVKADLDKEVLSPGVAERVFGVAAALDAAADEYVVDEARTRELRAGLRARRRARAVPVAEWYAKTRERVAAKAVDPLVAGMYRDSMRMSVRFGESFRGFWDLDSGFSF